MSDDIMYGYADFGGVQSFWDLPAEERASWTERAERETGSNFHDLPPEERARWHERATGRDPW